MEPNLSAMFAIISTFLSIDCIVNVHLEYGMTLTYSLDDACSCLIVYRMKISGISSAVVVDLYTY